MIPDAYFILTARSYGYIVLSIICFIGFLLFYFHPLNGINRWFGISLLCISFLAAMIIATGLAAINSKILTPEQLLFFLPYWTKETVALWLAVMVIIALGVYLMFHHE